MILIAVPQDLCLSVTIICGWPSRFIDVLRTFDAALM